MFRPTKAAFAVALATVLPACADGADEPRNEEFADEASESLRIGRVHVVIEPDSEDQLQITARFALIRGFDEDFGRARTDMIALPREVLRPGQCTSDSFGYVDDADLDPDEPQELILVDAGELNVNVNGENVAVPLSLVPDLLPYMTGVEYVYYGDDLPESDAMGPTLTVEAEGSTAEQLPAFSVDGEIPADVALRSQTDGDALVVQWNVDADDDTATDPVTLRISATQDGDVLGDDITCLVDDRGQARLDLATLRRLGLPQNADSVRVVASRTSESSFDAGEFTGSELIVERRASVSVSLR